MASWLPTGALWPLGLPLISSLCEHVASQAVGLAPGLEPTSAGKHRNPCETDQPIATGIENRPVSRHWIGYWGKRSWRHCTDSPAHMLRSAAMR